MHTAMVEYTKLHFFCQVWFSLVMLVGLVINWSVCVIITVVARDPATAQNWCCCANHYMFRYMLLKACPWIRVSPRPLEDIERLMGREKVCVLMNHTSFFDTVVFVSTIPGNVIWRYRALMKHGLFKVPLLGSICRMVGHFPVYFLSKDQGTFTVDKVEQAKVLEQMKAYVDSKGSLSIFPEARINPNPAVLCPFRKGIFNVIEEKGMSVVSLTFAGSNTAWPRDYIVGGLPARISMKLTEVAGERHGMSADEIRQKAETIMQADVDFLLGKRVESKPKES